MVRVKCHINATGTVYKYDFGTLEKKSFINFVNAIIN